MKQVYSCVVVGEEELRRMSSHLNEGGFYVWPRVVSCPVRSTLSSSRFGPLERYLDNDVSLLGGR